ncbi:hypothetical protein [Pseudomonas sp. Pseusp97]|uniref:hypothetical protein n=1 Tax=Pseudomonas sp. Pseusp97 TaxID=3243065 RepID=UPI0039A47DB9
MIAALKQRLVVAELLRELAPLIANEDLNRRLRCAARQLLRDADALEEICQELASSHH